MKHIGFKHQRENKQNSDKTEILLKVALKTITLNPTPSFDHCIVFSFFDLQHSDIPFGIIKLFLITMIFFLNN